GSRLPIYNTAIGWAYHAAIDDEQGEALFEQMKAVAGKDWKAEKARIDQALDFYATHRFVLNNGIQHPGIIAVAVPVQTPGRGVLAMNLATWNSGGAEQTMVNEAGPALRHLAELLEAQEPRGDRHG